ncbi:porin family protein [uncultured Marixanthomonas sp.]|uniref:porin family protein n=1 Tax=uncultured Marixanthomonas sp. TaxID=757245 RepID=UPI0030D95A8D|tara:strand:- start:139629 stop:140333 length:705 start_codon:yes stop_codon:yes gene_type:complete
MLNSLKIVFFLIGLLYSFISFSQEKENDTILDSKYREDQFYIGLNYNIISSVPSGVDSRGLSGGIQLGYFRDMPINKRRNIAIAIGAGLAFDQFGQNLFIGEEANENTIFSVIDDEVDFDQNRFTMAAVEVPVQFRWRTSTAENYKFWRIYAGMKLGYVYWYKATFKQPNNKVIQTDIPEFDNVRLSANLSFGYNTFNFYASYSINPFFKDATTSDNQTVDFKAIKLGLIFYIL